MKIGDLILYEEKDSLSYYRRKRNIGVVLQEREEDFLYKNRKAKGFRIGWLLINYIGWINENDLRNYKIINSD